jgi:hypothetical protein
MRSHFKRLLLLGLGCALLASADEVQFSFSTTGSFSSGTPSDLSFSGIGTASAAGYTGTTSGGALTLSNLGTLTLKKPSQGSDNYSGDTFTLNLIFFAPTGVGTPTTFNAALSGTVNTQQGSVLIDFGPAKTFHFSNAFASGGFDLSINDLTLNIPHDDTTRVTQILKGGIANAYDPPAAVPEPVSIVLLGSVTLLVSAKLRRQVRKS